IAGSTVVGNEDPVSGGVGSDCSLRKSPKETTDRYPPEVVDDVELRAIIKPKCGAILQAGGTVTEIRGSVHAQLAIAGTRSRAVDDNVEVSSIKLQIAGGQNARH